MSYLHIVNLYKEQDILLFKKCYALEKIHGTSSSVIYIRSRTPKVTFFSGGESHENFIKLFDEKRLETIFDNYGLEEMTVFGEAYGGKQQGMSYLYGKELKFIAFDVRIGNNYWQTVPKAELIVKELGLEFVHYNLIETNIDLLEKERDADSVQAIRNGIDPKNLPQGKTLLREGIVLRPLIELYNTNEERIICKFKNEKFSERKNEPKVIDSDKLKVLSEADEVAEEWVVLERLRHVLDKLPKGGMELVPKLVPAMLEDVIREGNGEIIDSKEVRKAISKKTVDMYKNYLNNSLKA